VSFLTDGADHGEAAFAFVPNGGGWGIRLNGDLGEDYLTREAAFEAAVGDASKIRASIDRSICDPRPIGNRIQKRLEFRLGAMMQTLQLHGSADWRMDRRPSTDIEIAWRIY
jgi:hypothetical protein